MHCSLTLASNAVTGAGDEHGKAGRPLLQVPAVSNVQNRRDAARCCGRDISVEGPLPLNHLADELSEIHGMLMSAIAECDRCQAVTWPRWGGNSVGKQRKRTESLVSAAAIQCCGHPPRMHRPPPCSSPSCRSSSGSSRCSPRLLLRRLALLLPPFSCHPRRRPRRRQPPVEGPLLVPRPRPRRRPSSPSCSAPAAHRRQPPPRPPSPPL